MGWQDDQSQLLQGGFSPQDVNDEEQRRRKQMFDGGFSGKEIDDYFGVKQFDPKPSQDFVKQNLQDYAEKNAVPGPNGTSTPKQADSFVEALQAGWQTSVIGLLKNRQMPTTVLPEHAGMFYRMASGVGSIAGDLPAMIAGGIGGDVAGGGVNPITAGAGAFALPAGMRRLLMDHYAKGDVKDFGDFWERAGAVTLDAIKGGVTGAATAGAGALAEGVVGGGLGIMGAGASAGTTALAKATSEIATLTTVGKALEGQAPKPEDFLDAALLVGGLHLATGAASNLRELYANCGMKPEEAAAKAQQDPILKQDLVSTNPDSAKIAEQATGLPQPESNSDDPDAPNVQAAIQDGADPDSKPPTQTGEPAAPVKTTEEDAATPLPEPGSIEEARAAIRSQMQESPEPAKEGYSFRKFYTDFVDRLDPVKQAIVKMIGKDAFDKIAANVNPLNLMRAVSDAPAKARAFLTKGAFGFSDLKYDGKPSFYDIINRFKGNDDALAGFEEYLVSKRALEIEASGKTSGMDVDAAQKVVDWGSDKYEESAQNMTDFQNSVLKYVKDSGRLSDAQYDSLVEANKSYIPFSRIFTPEEQAGASGGNKGSGLGSLKELQGSDRAIQDPLQRIMENTQAMIKFAEKNRAMTSLINLVESDPDQTMFEKVKDRSTVTKAGVEEMQKYLDDNGINGSAKELELFRRQAKYPLSENEFELYRDGKREVWSTDKDTAAAIKSLDGDTTSQNIFMTLARATTGILKVGTTLTPDFIMRHLFRNQLISGTYSEVGRVPFTGIVSAIGDIWNQNDAYWNWMKSGGAGGAFLENDKAWFNENVGRLQESTGFMDSARNSLMSVKSKVEALGTIFENSTRLAEFKRIVGDETSGDKIFQGGAASRDITIDYQRMGAKMSAWNAITAFQNVSIQSGDRLVRAFQDDPAGTMTKGLAYITAPTLALWWATKDDERIKEIPQWEKDMFWLFPTDNWQKAEKPSDANGLPSYLVRNGSGGSLEINKGTVLRLPIPQELGVLFKVLPERILNAFAGSSPETLKSLEQTIGGLVTPAFIPDIAKAPMEQFTNRNFFTGSSLVPYGAEKLLPEYQYTDYTSETAKIISKFIAKLPGISDIGPTDAKLASPPVIDNYIKEWSGTLGTYALQVADKALSATGVVKDLKPESTLADIPFVKAFVARYPTSNAQSIQDFRSLYDQHEKVLATIQMLGKQGNVDEMSKVMQAHQQEAFQLNDTKSAMANMNHMIQMVYQNPDMSKSDKRQLIDNYYYMMINAAHEGVRVFGQMDSALKAQLKSP